MYLMVVAIWESLDVIAVCARYNMGDELKVLSFNVWGLRFVSKDRVPRLKAIAQFLANSDFDVVCLQEIWIHEDFLMVKREVAGVLPNARFFHTGALGSGLAILTRFPIIASTTLPYSLSGLPLHVIAGDFFVNKAAGSIVILHPELGEVEVWNTHMHAAGEGGLETNRAHRLAQAWELSRAVNMAAERGRYVIACGDFNSLPHSLPMAVLRHHASLADSWSSCNRHPGPSSAAYHPDPLPSDAEEAIRMHGVTCDSPLNSYSAGKPLTGDAIKWKGKRLDYILFRGPESIRRRSLLWAFRRDRKQSQTAIMNPTESNGVKHIGENPDTQLPSIVEDGPAGVTPDVPKTGASGEDSALDRREHPLAPRLRCVKSQVVLTGVVPGERFSYSDHFPLLSVFRVGSPQKRDKEGLTPSDSPPNEEGHHSDGAQQGRPGARRLVSFLQEDNAHAPEADEQDELFPSDPADRIGTLTNILRILQDYITISRRMGKTHLRLFAGSIVLALALTVSSAWQPKSYIQPIWTLLGLATGAFGATMLYVGFVWGRWEEGLLMEVMAEMEMELRLIQAGLPVTH